MSIFDCFTYILVKEGPVEWNSMITKQNEFRKYLRFFPLCNKMQLVYSDASDVGVNVGVVLFTYAKIYFVRLLKGKLVLGLTYCIKIEWVSFAYRVCNQWSEFFFKSLDIKINPSENCIPPIFSRNFTFCISLIPGTIHSNAWFIDEKWPRFRPGLFHHFPIDL